MIYYRNLRFHLESLFTYVWFASECLLQDVQLIDVTTTTIPNWRLSIAVISFASVVIDHTDVSKCGGCSTARVLYDEELSQIYKVVVHLICLKYHLLH